MCPKILSKFINNHWNINARFERKNLRNPSSEFIVIEVKNLINNYWKIYVYYDFVFVKETHQVKDKLANISNGPFQIIKIFDNNALRLKDFETDREFTI